MKSKFNKMISKINVGVILINLLLLSSFNCKNFLEEETFNPAKIITYNSFSNELAKYFVNFASFGYCQLEQILDNTCCSTIINAEGWELLKADKIVFHNFNFAVLRHKDYKKIVITFTGTRGVYELIREVIDSSGVVFKNNPTEKIMNFFNTVYISLEEKIKDFMEELKPLTKDYQFILVGHSLGGAVASIAALDFIRNGYITQSETNPVLITYGQPRTGNDVFANQMMKYLPIVFRVVKQGDLVPSVPWCVVQNDPTKNCLSTLSDYKFSKNFTLTEEQEKEEISHFFTWHSAGLKLFSNDMEAYVDCGEEYGDNNPNPECKLNVSYSTKGHIIYFGIWVSRYCKTLG